MPAHGTPGAMALWRGKRTRNCDQIHSLCGLPYVVCRFRRLQAGAMAEQLCGPPKDKLGGKRRILPIIYTASWDVRT